MLLLRAIGLADSPYALQVSPRLVACCFGLCNDYAALRLSAALKLPQREVAVGRLLVASSYVAGVHLARTLSNSVECALFSLLLVFAVRRRRSEAGTARIAFVAVAGVFNRPTFALFACAPIALYCRRNALVYAQVALYAVAMSAPYALADTLYYRPGGGGDGGVGGASVTLTPLNFAAYNADPANLATHGRHARWTHALVNAPLLFGPAAVACVIACVAAARNGVGGCPRALVAVVAVPLAAFSAFCHQEPRFILPLIVPVMLLAASVSWPSSGSNGRLLRRLMLIAWLSFNALVGAFYGSAHQSGVTRSLAYLHGFGDGGPITAYYSDAYMPPRHLAPARANIVDLQPMADKWLYLGAAVASETTPPGHAHLLMLPGGVAASKCLDELPILAARVTSFVGHVSTENLPTLDDLFVCSGGDGNENRFLPDCRRPLLNRDDYCSASTLGRFSFLFSFHVFSLTAFHSPPNSTTTP